MTDVYRATRMFERGLNVDTNELRSDQRGTESSNYREKMLAKL